jgi:GT2 family glycosyltransferase
MDCYSRSGLGILVPFNKFIITKKEKCFEHSYPEDWKLDPKSGKKLWREVDYYNPEVFPEWADSEYDGLYDASIGDYDIVLLDDDDANDFLIKEGEFLPLYCAAFYRSDLNLIGPFKEYFAGGEDVELSARLQHKGLNQAVCGKAWVNHSCLDSFSALKGKQDKLNNKASLVKLSNDIKKYGWKLD